MINRDLTKIILDKIDDKKVIIILGPRQSGKTTLLKSFVKDNNLSALWWNADETDIRQLLQNPTSTILNSLIGKNKLLIIDEAQRIENIGLCIKLIHDNIEGVKVIATGSSSFELSNRINEPLTGRKWEYLLYPISYSEFANNQGKTEAKRLLSQRLIYGNYPDVINNPGSEINILQQLSDSYLYKDILNWANIKKPDRLESLIQAIAFQLGNQVSYLELSRSTGLDKDTVEKYITLLERSFIIFRLNSFSRNLRTELKKSRKIYFYDNGIRNSIIKNFNPIGLRNDTGALWENFLISERIKKQHYNQIYTNNYFWRTHDRNEIDYIEDVNGKLYCYEFKWKTHKKVSFPRTFTETYLNSETFVITQENYEGFII